MRIRAPRWKAEGLHDDVSTFGILVCRMIRAQTPYTPQGISNISLLFWYENPFSLTVRLSWIIYLIGPEEYSLLPYVSIGEK